MQCEVPTKSRIKSFLIKQQVASKCYYPKVIISLGIVLTTCGVILCLFGVVFVLIDSIKLYLGIEIWIAIIIIICGLITTILGRQIRTRIVIYFYVFTSIITIASTGILTILIINVVLRAEEISRIDQLTKNISFEMDKLLIKSPIVMINLMMLTFSSISFVISVINFCMSCQEACECYSISDLKKNNESFIINSNQEITCRRDRIISWIVQQSELQNDKSIWDISSQNDNDNVKKKKHYSVSASTSTTRLSAYEI